MPPSMTIAVESNEEGGWDWEVWTASGKRVRFGVSRWWLLAHLAARRARATECRR